MLLGVLSDTHDELGRTRAAVALLRDAGAAALVHCGDLTTPAVVEICAELPLRFVFGNHDADAVPELLAAALECGATCLGWGGLFEFGGLRVGVAHGHMTSDVRRVLVARPDVLLCGHSHAASDEVRGGARRVSPGALHRAGEYTAAVLDTASGAVRFMRVV